MSDKWGGLHVTHKGAAP